MKTPKLWSTELVKMYTKWLNQRYYLVGDGHDRDELIDMFLNDVKNEIITAYES